jgi:lysophospholipase L1-like esterase
LKDWQKIFLNAHEKSRQLALEFEILADSLEVHFFDAASVCACDPKDGFHINGVGHEAIGVALAEKILSMGWPDD